MQPVFAIGLISGTSLDGTDAALIETDDIDHVRPVALAIEEYMQDERTALADATHLAWEMATPDPTAPIIRDAKALLTRRHADLVARLRAETRISFPGTTGVPRPLKGGAPHPARPIKEAVS